MLPEFIEKAQEKLKLSSVLIVGLGRLGAISFIYLVTSIIVLIANDIVYIFNCNCTNIS